MGNRILLTGGTGFLGSRICRALLDAQHQVVFLKRSFSKTDRVDDLLPKVQIFNLDENELEKGFQGPAIDAIIHCATDYGRKNVDPLQLIEANLILPLRLLQLGAKYKIRAFLNSDTILDKRVNEYSLSKKQFVDWLQVFSNRFACANLALEHFYGPEDDRTKFVSSVISQFISNVPQIALTQGYQKRDFIYIDDVVSAYTHVLQQALTAPCGFSSYEVGSGESVEIRKVVLEIQSLIPESKSHPDFGALPYRENEVMESRIHLSPLKALGWRPQITLHEGLQRTIQFEKQRNLK